VKKLIVAVIMIAIIFGLGLLEISYDTKKYSEIKEGLIELHGVLVQNEKNVNVKEVWDSFDKVNGVWQNCNDTITLSTNHNVVRSINERFAYLEDFIKANVYSDALSTTNTLIDTAEYMKEEKYLLLGNLF